VHLTEKVTDEEIARRLKHKYARRRIGRVLFVRRTDDLTSPVYGGPMLQVAETLSQPQTTAER
jgi:hypothetical protein